MTESDNPVLKTSDYSIFRKHESNRQLVESNLQRLSASISSNNMLRFRPILVDQHMFVLDGQHRLEVAKLLQLDVYYQVNSQSNAEDIILLNANQRNWSVEDYARYYSSRGNLEYKMLLDYSKNRNVSIDQFISLFRGSCDVRSRSLKNGTFKFFNKEEVDQASLLLDMVEEVHALIDRYRMSTEKIGRPHRMGRALITLFKKDSFDFSVFKTKLVLKMDSVRKCTDTISYYTMFRDIYNYKNQAPVG